jgi:hypothetical protein
MIKYIKAATGLMIASMIMIGTATLLHLFYKGDNPILLGTGAYSAILCLPLFIVGLAMLIVIYVIKRFKGK